MDPVVVEREEGLGIHFFHRSFIYVSIYIGVKKNLHFAC